jgi:hypothetical protein
MKEKDYPMCILRNLIEIRKYSYVQAKINKPNLLKVYFFVFIFVFLSNIKQHVPKHVIHHWFTSSMLVFYASRIVHDPVICYSHSVMQRQQKSGLFFFYYFQKIKRVSNST